MRTVITYGTFDLFHVGHVKLLKRLRALGDRLIVGCSTDEFNALKGKQSALPYEQRKEVLLACRHVDEVFPEVSWDQKPQDIRKYKADIFAIGDDWSGHFDTLQEYCEVIYLPRTTGISTTELKKMIVVQLQNELMSVLHDLQGAEKRLRDLAGL